MRSLLSGIVFVCVFSLGAAVHAQRGGAFSSEDEPLRTPLSGFPGFFDTYMADPDTVVTEVPTFSVDYGLNENVTIGTNALILVPLLVAPPAFMAKARYRLYSEERFVSTLTGYGLFFRDPGDDDAEDRESYFNYFSVATSNHTFYLSEKDLLTVCGIGAFMYQNGKLQDGDDTIKITTTGSAFLAALTYQRFFKNWFSVQALLGGLVYASANVDSSAFSIDVATAMDGPVRNRLFGRAEVDFKLGRWVLSPQLIWIGGAKGILPWFSATKVW